MKIIFMRNVRITITLDSNFERKLRLMYADEVKRTAGKNNISYSKFIENLLRKNMKNVFIINDEEINSEIEKIWNSKLKKGENITKAEVYEMVLKLGIRALHEGFLL